MDGMVRENPLRLLRAGESTRYPLFGIGGGGSPLVKRFHLIPHSGYLCSDWW